MSTSPKKDFPVIDLINQFSGGIVLADERGRTIFLNNTAQKLMSLASTEQKKQLKTIIKQTLLYKSELVGDFPNEERVFRYLTQYVSNSSGVWIIVSVKDVSEEWIYERQQDILEHTSKVASIRSLANDWLRSLLDKVVNLRSIDEAYILFYNSRLQTLEAGVQNTGINDRSIKVKLGKGLLGKGAETGESVVMDTKADKASNPFFNAKKKPVLAIPLISATKLTGMLILVGKEGTHFREQDRAFYLAMSSRVATVIENNSLLERLEREHARLLAVLTNTNQGKLLLGASGQVLMTNPSFADLMQLEVDDLRGQKIQELLPELYEVVEKNESQNYTEIELTSLDGKPWVGIYIAKVSKDKNSNTVVTIRDITAEKHLEQLKNDFISTATHELRTPLTAILGYLSMLAGRGTLDEKQTTYVQRMEKASRSLFDLVEDLLSVLRIDQGGVKHNPQEHKALPIIQEIVHSLESKIAHKNIKMNLPEIDFEIYADMNSFQRVMLNLVDNAIKYSPNNSKISVKFSELPKQKMLKVEVKDNGLGIPKKQIGKVFEKFHRVTNELSVEAGGTGLGLYISKKLVEQWGGRISVKSTLGKGSTFALTVPLASRSFVPYKQKTER